jgi:hypothetical protein
MDMHVLLASLNLDPRAGNPQWLMTISVGIVAGLGVVGALHYLIRPRLRLVPPVKTPKQEPGDPFVHGSPTEQRKAFRREGNPVEVLIVQIASGAVQGEGFVIDRCVGGLGLFVEQPLEVGKHLNVRPTNAPPITPWVEIIVKSCRASNPGYEVGCQFVRTPPWAILLMFG